MAEDSRDDEETRVSGTPQPDNPLQAQGAGEATDDHKRGSWLEEAEDQPTRVSNEPPPPRRSSSNRGREARRRTTSISGTPASSATPADPTRSSSSTSTRRSAATASCAA